MKTKAIKLFKDRGILFFWLALILMLPTTKTFAQSWPATSPATLGTYNGLGPANPTLGHSGALGSLHLNCDMYADYSSGSFSTTTGSPSKVLWAMVWQYQVSGNDSVAYTVYDEFSGSLLAGCFAGKMPDVALGDDNSVRPGRVQMMISYITTGGNIEVRQYQIDNLFGIAAPTANLVSTYTASSFFNTYTVVDPPHIDACPDPASFSYYWSGSNTYAGQNTVVVTWSGNNSGNYEVYAKKATFTAGFPLGSPTYIDDGRMPDIAAVVRDHGSGSYSNTSYLVYMNQSLTDVLAADWDMNTTVNLKGALESSVTLSSNNITPRIEAMNVENTTVSAVKTFWEAVANLNVSGLDEIHGYDNTNGTVSLTNYSAATPLAPFTVSTTGINGYMPTVAMGCGPDGYAPGATSAIGNTNYTTGWYIQNNEYNALSLSNSGSGIVAGYAQINNASVAPPTNVPVLALSNCSNSGDDILSVWDDGTNIYGKHSSGNSFAFKPTIIAIPQKLDRPFLYPNPARDIVRISGTDKASYVVTNISGSVLLTGSIDAKNNSIDILKLTPGTYVLTLLQNGKSENMKFVKD